jgi:DNA-binding response OmpR family regulator
MADTDDMDKEIGIAELADINELEEISSTFPMPNVKFKKILVVDDLLYIVKSIAKILQEEGYFVITAKTGKEALAKYTHYSPDIITVDQNLPDMKGKALVEKIRFVNKDTKTKIIFISAVDEKDEIKSILNLGVSHYLVKPFKKSRLIDAINSLNL